MASIIGPFRARNNNFITPETSTTCDRARRSTGQNTGELPRGVRTPEVALSCTAMLSSFAVTREWGAGPPHSNTTRDAPPVAVSRVGCCDLSLACSFVTAKFQRSCYIVSMPTNLHRYYGAGYSKLLSTPSACRHTARSRSLPGSYGAGPPASPICSRRLRSHA